MSPVAFLGSPGQFSASVLTKGVDARALEALAFDGRLDPAEWVAYKRIDRPHQEPLIRTGLHDLPSAQSSDSSPPVSEMDWARARWGVEWPEGPQASERVALWALSQAQPDPEATPGLIDLALRQRWRFVLKAVCQTSLMPSIPESSALVHSALEAQWPTGIATVFSALLAPASSQQTLDWFSKWSSSFTTAAALEGVLAGLSSSVSAVDACARWLKAWKHKEDWKEEELGALAQIVVAVGEPTDAEGVAVAKRARQLLLSNAPAYHVRKQALDYVGFHRRQVGEEVDLAAAVASSNLPTSSWEQVLKTARRAAVCAHVLEKMKLGTPEYRRTQSASLHWLAQAAVQRTGKARPSYWERASFASATAKRQSRIQASLEKQAWTDEELMAGLVALRHSAWWPEVRQLGFEWLAKPTNSSLVLEQACQRVDGQFSVVAQLLAGSTASIVPLGFLDAISPWFVGPDSDLSIASQLLEVACKAPDAPWLEEVKKKAWDNPFLECGTFTAMESDAVQIKLVALVGQAVQAGRLDVSGVTWDCLGAMKPLTVQLKQYALDRALPAATSTPRPLSRM